MLAFLDRHDCWRLWWGRVECRDSRADGQLADRECFAVLFAPPRTP